MKTVYEMFHGPYVITAGKSRQMVSIPPSTSRSTVAFCFSVSNITCQIKKEPSNMNIQLSKLVKQGGQLNQLINKK